MLGPVARNFPLDRGVMPAQPARNLTVAQSVPEQLFNG
jgi:hypothetical protein